MRSLRMSAICTTSHNDGSDTRDVDEAEWSDGNDVNTLCRHTAGDTTSRRMAWLVDAKASRSAVPSRGAMADAKTLLGRAAKLAAEAAAEGADEDGMLRGEREADDNEGAVNAGRRMAPLATHSSRRS